MFEKILETTETIAVAETSYSDVLDMSQVNAKTLEATLDVTSISGSGTSLDVTPQYSYDKERWYDMPADGSFTQVLATGSETLQLGLVAVYIRFKKVVAGATPNLTFTIYAVPK